jgi:hypothetical protein
VAYQGYFPSIRVLTSAEERRLSSLHALPRQKAA